MKRTIFCSWLPFFILISIGSEAQKSDCKKGYEITSLLTKNLERGLYIYSPKKVRTIFDEGGEPIYKIKGKYRSIVFMNQLTRITCEENKQGVFFVTKFILEKWKNWLDANCR